MRRLAATVLLAAVGSAFAAWGGPPNIVFFFTDDQRHDTLGCAGHPVVKTPTIDSLAARGVRFTNMTVSQSICWASRTSILTGLTGRSYGTPGQRDVARAEAGQVLYSDLLRGAGYRTGFYGKWHAKMPKDYRPDEHFDEYERIMRNPYFKPQADGSKRHETELIVDRGIEFIRHQPKSQPFALNLWFNAAHAEDRDQRPGSGHFPWPKAVDGMYEDGEMPAPKLNDSAIYESHPDFLKESLNRERFFWRWDTPEKYETNLRAYFRMISGIDGAMRRFLDALDEAGLAENTIIVYSADNGYYMGNRGFAGKWTHYEESLRVPLIIYDPRLPEGRRGTVSDAPVMNLDLPPTFLDWAGVEVPVRYEGRSLRPAVGTKAPADWRTETFHEHFAVRDRIPAWEGLRTPRFKYARYFDEDPPYEFLHDLKNDPDELVNLAADPAHRTVLERLRAGCAKRVARYGGPLRPFEAPVQEN